MYFHTGSYFFKLNCNPSPLKNKFNANLNSAFCFTTRGIAHKTLSSEAGFISERYAKKKKDNKKYRKIMKKKKKMEKKKNIHK